jgi:hypothetical protein
VAIDEQVAMSSLVDQLAHGPPPARRTAASLLSRVETVGTRDVLGDALLDTDGYVRVMAAVGLAARKYSDSRHMLLAARRRERNPFIWVILARAARRVGQ